MHGRKSPLKSLRERLQARGGVIALIFSEKIFHQPNLIEEESETCVEKVELARKTCEALIDALQHPEDDPVHECAFAVCSQALQSFDALPEERIDQVAVITEKLSITNAVFQEIKEERVIPEGERSDVARNICEHLSMSLLRAISSQRR